MRLRACWPSLMRCDLDLCEVRVCVLTVAAMPGWQNSNDKTKTTTKPMPAERFPEFNALYLSPEFTQQLLHETGH